MTCNYNEWMSSIVWVFTIKHDSQNSRVACVVSPPIAKWSFPQHQWDLFLISNSFSWHGRSNKGQWNERMWDNNGFQYHGWVTWGWKKRKCTMALWEGALAIGIRTIATTVVANAFNIDHPNYVLKNVCVLVDKN